MNKGIDKVESQIVSLNNSLEYFENMFFKTGEEIIKQKAKYSNKISKENTFIKSILVHENHYLEKKYANEKRIFVEKKLSTLFDELKYCYREWVLLSPQLIREDQFRVTRITLKKKIKIIESLFSNLFDNLVFYDDFTYNNFIKRRRDIEDIYENLSKEIQITANLAFGEEYFFKTIDFSNIQQLSFDEIFPGDILLLKKEDFTLTPYRKILRWLLQSNIMHSAFVYDVIEEEIYVLQANSHDNKQIEIDSLERKKGYTYIVLRPKKPFNKSQVNTMKKYSSSLVGEKFSNAKIIIGSMERGIEFLFRKHGFYGRHTNPSKNLRGHFCSEIVASVYEKGGCPLGISKDSSIASPIDILNSRNLNIKGYIR